MQIESASSERTEAIAESIGRRLKGGEFIELSSDLGGGKTTFTRGLARGAGSTDHVSSPTFTISQIYKAPEFDIHHFDFYRLSEAGIIQDELFELIDNPKIVIAVEWSDVVRSVLPEDTIHITIAQKPEGGRTISIVCPVSTSYLVRGLK